MRLLIHKLTHWEYWPFELVYIPVYFAWAYYALRARSIFFFNAANPSIKNGGFFMESKKQIYDLIPSRYYPKTILVKEGTPIDEVLLDIEKAGIRFPLIAKPDIGLRGASVKKADDAFSLADYGRKANFDYIVQDVIPYRKEIGVFYVRHPDCPTGKITGIVAKEFVIVTGNGISTIEQLLERNPRFAMQIEALRKKSGINLDEIPARGDKRNLVPYGNHIRGSKFTDATSMSTAKLEKLLNDICLQVHEFYFGRLDIMFDTWEALEEGKNFEIIEINGAGSEPTHIYDPAHSIWFAWKELIRHIRYMYKVSVANHKKGFPYLSHKAGMEQYRLFRLHNRKIINEAL